MGSNVVLSDTIRKHIFCLFVTKFREYIASLMTKVLKLKMAETVSEREIDIASYPIVSYIFHSSEVVVI